MRYSNVNVYVVVNKGKSLPASCVDREIGEGVNRGTLPDGRDWTKDCFRSAQELIDIVHAMDTGDLEIKDASDFRELEEQGSAGPVEI